MYSSLLFTPLLLSEATGVDPTPLFVFLLIVLVTVPLAWWGGVKLVRSGKILLKFLGVLVLVYGLLFGLTGLYFLVALAST
jgi:hypothetical protein